MANRRSVEKEAFWRSHLQRQARSGASVAQYCRQQQLAQPSFYAWRREILARDHWAILSQSQISTSNPTTHTPRARLRHEATPITSVAPNSFVELDVVTPTQLDTPQAILEIQWRDTITIRLREDVASETLERVLRVIDRHSSATAGGSVPTPEPFATATARRPTC